MATHLSLIKSLTTMPVHEIMKSAKKREFRLRRLESEREIVRGDKRNVQRLYIHTKDSGKYSDVGWVVNDGVEDCMMCGETFGLLLFRHHCRSCGNLLCDACCPYRARIEELNTSGEVTSHRVCRLCYWDQEVVRAVVEPKSTSNVPSLSISSTREDVSIDRNTYTSLSMVTSATDRRVNELIQQSGLYSPKNNRKPPSLIRGEELHPRKREVIPTPSFVIKLKGTIRSSTNAKLFINVLHHKDFPWFLNVGDMPNLQYHSLRKFGADGNNNEGGGDTYAIDAVCNTDAIKSIPSEKQNDFIEYIVELVRNQDGFTLSPSFTLPKILNEYKDGPVRMCEVVTKDIQTLQPMRTYSNNSTSSNHDSADPVPRSMTFENSPDDYSSKDLRNAVNDREIASNHTGEYICVRHNNNDIYDFRRDTMSLRDLQIEKFHVVLGDIYMYDARISSEWQELFLILDSTTLSCFFGDDNDKVASYSIKRATCQLFSREEFNSFTAEESGNPNLKIALKQPDKINHVLKVDAKDVSKKSRRLSSVRGSAAVKINQWYLASSQEEILKNWEWIINSRSTAKKPDDPEYEPDTLKGHLLKQGHIMKTWNKRFFVLEKGYLKYYTDETLNNEKGEFGIYIYIYFFFCCCCFSFCMLHIHI